MDKTPRFSNDEKTLKFSDFEKQIKEETLTEKENLFLDLFADCAAALSFKVGLSLEQYMKCMKVLQRRLNEKLS